MKRQKRNAALLLAGLAALFIALCFLLGEPILRYAKDASQLRALVDRNALLGRLIYLAICFLQVVIALIPGEPVEILGGYVFGFREGTALFLLAALLGSTLVFLLVRRFGVKLVSIFFSEEQLEKLHFLRAKKGREFLFFFLFAIPGTPKDLLSYFAGLTDIPFGLWLLICSAGRIPSVITSTLGGSALGDGSYLTAAIVFAVTLAVSGGGLLLYQGILKQHEKKKKKETDTE